MNIKISMTSKPSGTLPKPRVSFLHKVLYNLSIYFSLGLLHCPSMLGEMGSFGQCSTIKPTFNILISSFSNLIVFGGKRINFLTYETGFVLFLAVLENSGPRAETAHTRH